MNFEQFKNKVIYSKFSKLNPFNPLFIWGDTTNDLDEFYKRPDVNLTDSNEDLIKKNDMRHIVGSARLGQLYSNPYAVFVDEIKETFDYAKDFLNPKTFGTVKESTKEDTKTDWSNNYKGINYTDKYPNATEEDILQYAYGLANGAKPISDYDSYIENSNPPVLYGHVENNVNYEDIDNNKVYTFEEIKKMKPKEFLKNQQKILEEFTSGRMMYENEAKEKVKSGELIYVDSYTRQDGTKVSGYYRRR